METTKGNSAVSDHAIYAAEMVAEVYLCNLGSLKGCSGDPGEDHEWWEDLEDEIGHSPTDEERAEWLHAYAAATSTLVETERNRKKTS